MAKIPVTRELDQNFALRTRQIYSSAGSFTWNKPEGLKAIVVEVQGAGGGGGGAVATAASQASIAKPGGSGGYTKKFILAENLGASETVTVGAGGVGGTGGSGTDGGVSSFGLHTTAAGGRAGTSSTASTGLRTLTSTSGFTNSSGGDINIFGGNTEPAYSEAGNVSFISPGGSSKFGIGGGGKVFTSGTQSGINANGNGAGGGGSGNGSNGYAAQTGGDGTDGIVIVWEYY